MADSAFDLRAAWRAIERVPSPGPAGPPPRPVLPRIVGRTASAAASALRVLRASLHAVDGDHDHDPAIDACLSSIRQFEACWQKECGETGFIRRRRELERSKQILESIGLLEAHERRGREERQRRRRERLQSALSRGAGELTDCRRAVLARRAELARMLAVEHRRLARLRAGYATFSIGST